MSSPERKLTVKEHYSPECQNLGDNKYVASFVAEVVKVLVAEGITERAKQDTIIQELCAHKYLYPIDFTEFYNDAHGRKSLEQILKKMLPATSTARISEIVKDLAVNAKRLNDEIMKEYLAKYTAEYFTY